MSTTGETVVTTTPAATTTGAPTVTYPDDYEELRNFRAQMTPVVERLRPYWESDIVGLLDDEEEMNFVREARKNRKRIIDESKPKVPAELQPALDELRSEIAPVIEYIKGESTAKETAKHDAEEAARKVNHDYAQRLVAERPDLAEENYAGMVMLASLAQRDGLSLEDSWKRYGSRFQAPAKGKKPPEQTLRPSMADRGIPGPSEGARGKVGSRGELARRMSENIRASGVRG